MKVESLEVKEKSTSSTPGAIRHKTAPKHQITQAEAKKFLTELLSSSEEDEKKISLVQGPAEPRSATQNFQKIVNEIFSPDCKIQFSYNYKQELIATTRSLQTNLTELLEETELEDINLTTEQLDYYLKWVYEEIMFAYTREMLGLNKDISSKTNLTKYNELHYMQQLAIYGYCSSKNYQHINSLLRNKGRYSNFSNHEAKLFLGYAVIITHALKSMKIKDFKFEIVSAENLAKIDIEDMRLDTCYITCAEEKEAFLQWAYRKADFSRERTYLIYSQIVKGEIALKKYKDHFSAANKFYLENSTNFNKLLKIQKIDKRNLAVNDKHVITFLKDLINYIEPKSTLYREETIFDTNNLGHLQEIIDAHASKETFKLSSFTSTSVFKYSSTFGPRREVEMKHPSKAHFAIIGNLDERDVAPYSNLTQENEVLVRANSRFFCTQYKKVEDQHYFVLHQLGGLEK